MHPLIPDDWNFFSLESGEHLGHKYFTDLQGRFTRDFMDSMEMGDMWYSFGISSAGAVCLHNYPNALRELVRIDGQITDLATLDIVRDRERGVPRYNDFREMLRMPRRNSIDGSRRTSSGPRRSTRSTAATTSTSSTCRSVCRPSSRRRASASPTPHSGSSS